MLLFGPFSVLLSGPSRCYYLGQVVLAYKDSGFKRFLAHTVIILCLFMPNYLAINLKIAFFKEGVQKLCFSIFCVLGLNVENYFLACQNTIKLGVSANFGVFLLLKRENRQKENMITGISGFGFFFCPKMAVSRFNVSSSFSSLPFLTFFIHLSLCFLTFGSLKVAHRMRL